MHPLSDQQIKTFLTVFPEAKRDEPLAPHTYLKIGGPAQLYFEAANADDLIGAIETAKAQNLPWYILGGGSNVLVSDEGYRGLVIRYLDQAYTVRERTVSASAGASTVVVAKAAAEAGLTGFEWGTTVPGTIGGAICGNAGCFGGEMKDLVVSVDAYDPEAAKRIALPKLQCKFGYRDSLFKHKPLVILKTLLSLAPSDKERVQAKAAELQEKRRQTQPQGELSAGCMFKNFEYVKESDLDILKRSGDPIPEEMLKRKSIGAGWLVDKLGLKGTAVGAAKVSEGHGNFLVNTGGARAQDVLQLTSLIKMKVRDELGIMLEDEVRLVGF